MTTLRETEELKSKSNEDKRKDEGMQITIENEKEVLYENCNTQQKPYKSLAKYLEDESNANSFQLNNLHRNIRTENNLKISRKLDFKPALKPEYKNPNISNMLKNTDDFKIDSTYSVSIQPGEIELTRTRPERLTASACVSAEMPPLAAV